MTKKPIMQNGKVIGYFVAGETEEEMLEAIAEMNSMGLTIGTPPANKCVCGGSCSCHESAEEYWEEEEEEYLEEEEDWGVFGL